MKKLLFIGFSWLFLTPVYAQDFALKQLETSTRHHEWIKLPRGERTLHAFVVYPEVKEKAMTALIIHENRGLTDWVRSFADQLAAKGYIAIAPDLLSDFDATHRRTTDFNTSDAARDALYQLKPDQVSEDLTAVLRYGKAMEAGNGKMVVMGFCWGGAQTFRLATLSDQMEASIVFYGNAPESEEAFAGIKKPVYGFYAENDQRINAELDRVKASMANRNAFFEMEMYPGAGHAYMRSGDDPNGLEANKAARNASWERLIRILKSLHP
jgi:carboxymethylenebutenolidase